MRRTARKWRLISPLIHSMCPAGSPFPAFRADGKVAVYIAAFQFTNLNELQVRFELTMHTLQVRAFPLGYRSLIVGKTGVEPVTRAASRHRSTDELLPPTCAPGENRTHTVLADTGFTARPRTIRDYRRITKISF